MDGSSQRTASTLEFLEGSRSGIRYDADHLRGTDPADGRTLLARYDLAAVRDRLTPDVIAGRRRGVWRWEELLPVRVRSFMTTLGEGDRKSTRLNSSHANISYAVFCLKK